MKQQTHFHFPGRNKTGLKTQHKRKQKPQQTQNVSAKHKPTSGTCCSAEFCKISPENRSAALLFRDATSSRLPAAITRSKNIANTTHRTTLALHFPLKGEACCATRSVAFTAIYCKLSEPKQSAGNDGLTEASQTLGSWPLSNFHLPGDRGDLFSSHPATSPIFPLTFECRLSTQIPRF